MPARFLTEEEWKAIQPPFSYLTVQNEGFTDAHRVILREWVGAHCHGWAYWDGETVFAFERSGEAARFRLWLDGEALNS